MAQIDKFVSAVLDRPGGQIMIKSGVAPTMTVGAKRVPISKQVATVKQIRLLLAEIAPPQAREDLRLRGEAEFAYTAAGLEPATIVVRHSADSTQINICRRGDSPLLKEQAPGPPSLGPGPLDDPPDGGYGDEAQIPDLADADAPAHNVSLETPVPVAGRAPTPPVPPEAARPATSPQPLAAAAPPPLAAAPPPAPAPGVVAEAAKNLPRLAIAKGDTHAIDKFFRKLVSSGSSDLHMSSEEVPMIRKDGEMQRLDGVKVLSPLELEAYITPIIPLKNRDEYARDNDTDFAYEIAGLARFRCNVFRDRKGMGAVFRIIPADILSAEKLGLSDAIRDLCNLSKGLVLVTGPTGSGKSTTLCAMIDLINRQRGGHIITIEDPIEFVHPNKKCLVNQREIGVHTNSFKRALRAALREDPDIVLVGEMRDLETIAIAIETAETGHLVFGTLHTSTAYSTVDRLVDQYPADQQEQIRVMLSESLRGVISQTLCKKIGGGRVAALEVLIVTPAVANLIREGKTFQIPSIMQTGRRIGMALLNDVLLDYVEKKLVEPDEALLKAVDKASLRNMLRQKQLIPPEPL